MDFDHYHYRVFKFDKIVQLTVALIFASLGCTILLIARVNLTGSRQYSFLVWNLFLAWTPYFIALAIKGILIKFPFQSKIKFWVLVFAFIWLVFYPNSTYLLTDIVYIMKFPFYIPNKDSMFTPDTLKWFDIILSSSFAFIGHMIGLISLLIMHNIFDRAFNKLLSWLLVLGAMILCGYGIFLGRFVRLNSWDVFQDPLPVLKQVVIHMFSLNAILFSIGVGFFILITYLIVYFIYNLRR